MSDADRGRGADEAVRRLRGGADVTFTAPDGAITALLGP